jgi:hypothetical protein
MIARMLLTLLVLAVLLFVALAFAPGCADPCRTHRPDYYDVHQQPT